MNKIHNLQTPMEVCELMAMRIDKNKNHHSILEPTPGNGNLVIAIEKLYPDSKITAPSDFWEVEDRFDYIIANPPFTPCKDGYKYLYKFMKLSNNIIVLMPWFTLINSTKRTQDLIEFGLKRIHHLPRYTFPGIRVQTCVIELDYTYNGSTIFDFWDFTYHIDKAKGQLHINEVE